MYANSGEIIFPAEFTFLALSLFFTSFAISGAIFILLYKILGKLSLDIKMFLSWISSIGHLGYYKLKVGKINWDELRKKFTLKQIIDERDSMTQKTLVIIIIFLLIFGWTVPLMIDTYTVVSSDGIYNNRFFSFHEKHYNWADIKLVKAGFRSTGKDSKLYVSPNFVIQFNDSKKVDLGQDRWPNPENFSLFLSLLIKNDINIEYTPPSDEQLNELLYGKSGHYPNYLRLKEEIEKYAKITL